MVSEEALPDPFSASLAGRKLGRYEVLTRLASGGMAGVYVARALGVAGFERLFAIKVLHPHLAHEQEFISMFLDEARLAARIHHPNVVATIDISDTADAGYYLVMDYIEGDHLGALLQGAFKQGTRLPTAAALRVVVDSLYGLAAAHGLTDETGRRINLVHRDISPHNIMVSTDGISRITDFGVAKAEVRLSTTREGQFKGKLAYMAPEHASNGEADQRSDLFSMAIILWECLTGRRLFRAENHAATLNKICLEPIPSLSTVDPTLAPFDAILARGLAREPADRFQTAEDFAETIEQHAHELGGLATHRAVGTIVKEMAAEKLSRDSELIKSATADLAARAARDSAAAAAAAAAAEDAAPFVPQALVALPSTSAPAPPPPQPFASGFQEPRRANGPLIFVAIAVVVLGLGIAAWLMSGGDAVVTEQPLPPSQAEDITPTSPTVTPQPPSTEQPTEPPSEQAATPEQAPKQETAEAAESEEAEGDEATTTQSARKRRRAEPGESNESESDEPRRRAPQRTKPKASEEDDLLLNPYRNKNP